VLRQVLRFFAYLEEQVLVGALDLQKRVRTMHILFYLEDGSVQVTEPRGENSGIAQGAFLKRMRVPRHPPRGGSKFVNLEDLMVGKQVSLFARQFHITGCDQFTRRCVGCVTASRLLPRTHPSGAHGQCTIPYCRAVRADPPNDTCLCRFGLVLRTTLSAEWSSLTAGVKNRVCTPALGDPLGFFLSETKRSRVGLAACASALVG